jgi:hypothetical protein
VTDERRPLPPPRARPLAELSPDTLVARAEELAQRWAIALILARPLEGIAGVPLEELARDAPALCAQTIRALHSDIELDRLTESASQRGRERAADARSLGSMSGAHDAPALVLAVEALRGVLWEGALEETRPTSYGEPGSRLLGEVGDRLAYVCARVLLAALEAGVRLPREPDAHDSPPARADEPPVRQVHEGARAVLVDERAEAAPLREPPAARAPELALAPERPPAWQEIAIRDVRGGEGPGAWIARIARQLDRLREDGLPFAVLLVEPLQFDAVRLGEPAGEMLRLAAELEDALAVALRVAPARERAGQAGAPGPWSSSITRERPWRYWLLAPETDRRRCELLAERITSAVASVLAYRGAPLEVVIGTAVCPDDGMQAAELAAHADVGLYAARTARVRAHRGVVIDEAAER